MGSKGACSKGSSSYIHKTYVRPGLLDMHTRPYKDLTYHIHQPRQAVHPPLQAQASASNADPTTNTANE